MGSAKKVWRWGEDAKHTLNSLSEASLKANALATGQLRNLAYQLLHFKIEPIKKNPFNGSDPTASLIGQLFNTAEYLIYLGWPENKFAQVLKETADDKLREVENKAAQNITAANEIWTYISLMKPSEIYQLINDLTNNKPYTEIALAFKTRLNSLPRVYGRMVEPSEQGASDQMPR